MGFINTANTITIRARLTDLGREKLLTNNNTIFSHFILGDSDANYNTNEKLTTGKIISTRMLVFIVNYLLQLPLKLKSQ